MLQFVFERNAKELIAAIGENDYEAVISILFAYAKRNEKKS